MCDSYRPLAADGCVRHSVTAGHQLCDGFTTHARAPPDRSAEVRALCVALRVGIPMQRRETDTRHGVAENRLQCSEVGCQRTVPSPRRRGGLCPVRSSGRTGLRSPVSALSDSVCRDQRVHARHEREKKFTHCAIGHTRYATNSATCDQPDVAFERHAPCMRLFRRNDPPPWPISPHYLRTSLRG